MSGLNDTARQICARLILATDASHDTQMAALVSLGLDYDAYLSGLQGTERSDRLRELTRRSRELLLTASGIERYVSAAILHTDHATQACGPDFAGARNAHTIGK